MSRNECQMHGLPGMSEPLSLAGVIWQRRNRIRRILKRRMRYLANLFSSPSVKEEEKLKELVSGRSVNSLIQAGDRVRVRSKEEIRTTLDQWNQLHRCSFMEEMRPYCGTTQRVLKRVGKFLDERDYLTKKCKGVLILDNVMCEGTRDFGPCDRSCFFFWREEWLEKID